MWSSFVSSLKRYGQALIAGGSVTKTHAVGLALLLTLAAPFFLRPKGITSAKKADATVVIVTPHNESIRHEFTVAFTKYAREKLGQTVHVDWRTPGTGTTEIERFVSSKFHAAFQNYWTTTMKRTWTSAIGGAFNNRKLELPEDPVEDGPIHAARRAFLKSNVGVGIDLFFGGGAYPFQKFASMGYIVDSGIGDSRKDWFTDEVIPEKVSGEPFRDPQMRWIGACLSSFGICYNTDVLRRLGIQDTPDEWQDLGDSRYYHQIALADPTKSGSVTKAFEMLIQQEIHRAIANIKERPDKKPEEQRQEAIWEGWKNGINLIQRICANARYFTDSATKIPLDVAAGNAAAGMTIDFYGRTYNEVLKNASGRSRVQYLTPTGGSSVGADPIAMFRGAPNPEMAKAFMEFVLSVEGQRIWNWKSGIKGGPEKASLRRPAIRRDFYTAENMKHSADPDVDPYKLANEFEYVPGWTGRSFGAIRFIIRIACLDTHEEMRAAWESLIAAGFPPQATRMFHDVALVSYQAATGPISNALNSKDRLSEVVLAKQLGDNFRSNYRRALQLALQGK